MNTFFEQELWIVYTFCIYKPKTVFTTCKLGKAWSKQTLNCCQFRLLCGFGRSQPSPNSNSHKPLLNTWKNSDCWWPLNNTNLDCFVCFDWCFCKHELGLETGRMSTFVCIKTSSGSLLLQTVTTERLLSNQNKIKLLCYSQSVPNFLSQGDRIISINYSLTVTSFPQSSKLSFLHFVGLVWPHASLKNGLL